jgi:hypothetical protein
VRQSAHEVAASIGEPHDLQDLVDAPMSVMDSV